MSMMPELRRRLVARADDMVQMSMVDISGNQIWTHGCASDVRKGALMRICFYI